MKITVAISGLALVQWKNGAEGSIQLMDCEGHRPTLCVPMAAIQNRNELAKNAEFLGPFETWLSPSGDTLLSMSLDGCAVSLPGSGGVSADASDPAASWTTVRKALDFNFLADQAPAATASAVRTTVVVPGGLLRAGEPRAAWMKSCVWKLTAPGGASRTHGLTDHLLLEIDLPAMGNASIRITKAGSKARIVIGDDWPGAVPLSLFALCPLRRTTTASIEDAGAFTPLFPESAITNPVDVSGMESRANPFCPPGIYQL